MRRCALDAIRYIHARLEPDLADIANGYGDPDAISSGDFLSYSFSGRTVNLDTLSIQIKQCRICEAQLPCPPRPVFQASPEARILVVGQAPGIRVHESGIPFKDPSGVRLRHWMGVDEDTFYNPKMIALLPMGFCYPGTGKSGDLPPRPECAKTWRQPVLDQLLKVELTLVIGQYAINWHLGSSKKKNLTETVKAWRAYAPDIIPLPHPSPRNNIWIKKNPWFEDLIPVVRRSVAQQL